MEFGEELEKAINEMPSDKEVVQLIKNCRSRFSAGPVNGRGRGDKAVDPVGCRDGVKLLNSRSEPSVQ